LADGVIAVVGTPGTGKKTVARHLASSLQIDYMDLNEVAVEKGAVIGREENTYVVSTSKLRRLLLPIIKGRRLILSGHLIPSVLKRKEVELVILLRCAPEVLEARLASRGYSEAKVRENVAAEVLGVVVAEALKVFGIDKITEHDTTHKGVEETVAEILSVVSGKSPLSRPRIDWLPQVAEKGLLQRYFL